MSAPFFKDHFSRSAAEYARFRPGYPAALFEVLAELAPGRRLAWDCATGNGQAAAGLAGRFARVVATDASLEQLRRAARAPRVAYLRAAAEAAPLATASADLLTVAQAVHWFDLGAFYPEARRVLVARGVVALWTYHETRHEPAAEAVVARVRAVLDPYWPPERAWVEARYATLPFPFEEIAMPPLVEVEERDLEQLLGYLGTWSSAAAHRRATGRDAIAELRPELVALWGGDPRRRRRLAWPLHLRAGRV